MRRDHAIRTKRIEAFKAVMEHGSVTAAAAELFVTQPAVTKLLAQLEHNVGFSLFQRVKGRLIPTAEAKIFYQHVRQTYEALDDLGMVARDIRKLNRGNLVIGALPLLSSTWLPRQCARFALGRDHVSITLDSQSSARIQERVVSGQVDIGVGMIADDPGLNCEVLAELEAVCILPRDHRFVEKNVVTPEDFKDETFIMTGGVDGTRQRIEGFFKAFDVKVKVRFETLLASSTCGFVAAGAGVSLVNAFSAAEFAHLNYKVRAFRPTLFFQVYLLTPRNRPISHLAQQFIEQLKTSAAEELAPRPDNTD